MGRHRGDPPCVDLRRYAGGHHAVIPDTNGISGTKPGRIRCVDKDSLSCIQVQYEQAPPLHFNYNSLHDHARHLLWIYDRICRPGAIGDRTRGGGTSPYPPFQPDVGGKTGCRAAFRVRNRKTALQEENRPGQGAVVRSENSVCLAIHLAATWQVAFMRSPEARICSAASARI